MEKMIALFMKINIKENNYVSYKPVKSIFLRLKGSLRIRNYENETQRRNGYAVKFSRAFRIVDALVAFTP